LQRPGAQACGLGFGDIGPGCPGTIGAGGVGAGGVGTGIIGCIGVGGVGAGGVGAGFGDVTAEYCPGGIAAIGPGETGAGETGAGGAGVGETGVGETGVGGTGVGATGAGETGAVVTVIVAAGPVGNIWLCTTKVPVIEAGTVQSAESVMDCPGWRVRLTMYPGSGPMFDRHTTLPFCVA
jgi:hypothetical protein